MTPVPTFVGQLAHRQATSRRATVQDVNDRLADASSERGEYRQYLMEAQKELQKTRAELLEWSEGLSELKTVMEGLDGDLSDLFGETEYSAVMTEALEATRRLPGAPAPRPIACSMMPRATGRHLRRLLPTRQGRLCRGSVCRCFLLGSIPLQNA